MLKGIKVLMEDIIGATYCLLLQHHDDCVVWNLLTYSFSSILFLIHTWRIGEAKKATWQVQDTQE